MYQMVTGVTSDVGVPSTYLVVFHMVNVCFYVIKQRIVYGVCFTLSAYTGYIYHTGVSLSKVGANVQSRATADGANLQIVISEFKFPEDGRMLGWTLWAQNPGRARLQVKISVSCEHNMISNRIWFHIHHQFNVSVNTIC